MNGRLLAALLAATVFGGAIGWLARPASEAPDTAATVEELTPSPPHAPAPALPSPQAPSPPTAAPGGLTPPAPPSADGVAPVSSPAHLGTRKDVLERFAIELRRAYREHSGGEGLPKAAFDRLVANYERGLDTAPDAYARMLWEEEQHRRVAGELEDPPEVVLQVRTPRSTSVSMALEKGRRKPPEQKEGELDVEQGVDGRQPAETYAKGGLVPEGKVFVIERIEVRILWTPSAAGRSQGDFDLRVYGGPSIRFKGVGRGVRAVYEGRSRLSPGYEGSVTLSVRQAAAGVRMSGRLVPRAEAHAQSTRPFRRTTFDADGYLTGAPVLLQVACGRDRGRVSLDPQRDRVDEFVELDLWSESIDLEGRQEPRAHVQGRGAIPPDKVFEITRVLYRVRAAPRRSRLSIQVGRERVFNARREFDGESSGTWTGSVVLKPGREDDVYVEADKGMVEAWIHGTLRDP